MSKMLVDGGAVVNVITTTKKVICSGLKLPSVAVSEPLLMWH
jgi:hypothetical protein